MLIIRSAEDLARALDSSLSLAIKRLLHIRYEPGAVEIGIVQPGDAASSIEEAISFPILTDIDSNRFAHPDFALCFEWLLDHGAFWEMTFVFSDDGPATMLIIPDVDSIDPDLRDLCRSHATKKL